MSEYIDVIKKTDSFVIYGAGVMGRNVLKVLTSSVYGKHIEAFIVKDIATNPEDIDGVPVLALSKAARYSDFVVLVALRESYCSEAIESLRENGFNKIIPVAFDSDLWTELRWKWMNNTLLKSCSRLENLDDSDHQDIKKTLHIYVVHSEKDKKLNETVEDREYEIAIQVGSSSATDILYEIVDSKGDNISSKNRQYCELTGLYWAYKHDFSDYIGLSHYRRRFVLTEGQVNSIKSGKYDVILTVPIFNIDTVRTHYERDHNADDWKTIYDVIGRLSPEYLDAFKEMENGQYYFAYNMFIAKRDVFIDYCDWLFPILFTCEDIIGVKDDTYQNRYVGFLAERMMTVYLKKHPELNIVIADKHFIGN